MHRKQPRVAEFEALGLYTIWLNFRSFLFRSNVEKLLLWLSLWLYRLPLFFTIGAMMLGLDSFCIVNFKILNMVYNGVNTVIPIPKSFYKPKVRSGYQREFITLQSVDIFLTIYVSHTSSRI